MSTTISELITPQNIEDYAFALAPFLLYASNITQNLVPGASGFVLAVALGAIAKTLLSIGREPKSLEDWVQLIITALGIAATGLSANPAFLVYGTIIGFLAKALVPLQQGITLEDGFLAVGAFIALLGSIIPGSHGTELTNIGLLIGTLGKALPSISTNGAAGTKAAPAPAPPTPSTTGA